MFVSLVTIHGGNLKAILGGEGTDIDITMAFQVRLMFAFFEIQYQQKDQQKDDVPAFMCLASYWQTYDLMLFIKTKQAVLSTCI